MSNEDILLKQLQTYLNLDFNQFDKDRILGYLKNYRDSLPPIIVKEKPEEVVEFLPTPDKILCREDLQREARFICDKYGINYTRFLKPPSGKSTAQYTLIRKEFCKNILATYIATRKQLQEFLRIDHSTLIYYVSQKYYTRRKTA